MSAGGGSGPVGRREGCLRRRGYSFGRKMKRARTDLTSARETRHCPRSSAPGGSGFPLIRFSTMQHRSRLTSYGLAMLATAPVLLVRLASWSVPARVTALLLAGSLITSAWVGGLVPGLLSTVLTGLLVLPSGLSPELGAASPAGRLALPVLFLALAAGVSIAAGARKRGEAGRRESEARL